MEKQYKRVLIVDDDYEFLFALSVRLISKGYTVHGAVDGMAALEHLEHNLIDVIVTSPQTPNLERLELLTISRSRWPWIPIVVCSGNEGDLEYEATDRGAFAWVRKDRELTTLSEILAVAVRPSVHA